MAVLYDGEVVKPFLYRVSQLASRLAQEERMQKTNIMEAVVYSVCRAQRSAVD